MKKVFPHEQQSFNFNGLTWYINYRSLTRGLCRRQRLSAAVACCGVGTWLCCDAACGPASDPQYLPVCIPLGG
jgi:hypothetical protein